MALVPLAGSVLRPYEKRMKTQLISCEGRVFNRVAHGGVEGFLGQKIEMTVVPTENSVLIEKIDLLASGL